MIREVNISDAAAILEIYAPIIRDSHWSFETEVPTVQEFEERISKISTTHPYLVFDDGERVMGYAYATRLRDRAAYDPSVETSIYMHPDVFGQGKGRRLYQTLFKILELAGYSQLFAGATLPNAGSAAFHEALGFEQVGVWPKVGYKFEQWWDVGWWYRELKDQAEPLRIVPYSELRATPAFQALLVNA